MGHVPEPLLNRYSGKMSTEANGTIHMLTGFAELGPEQGLQRTFLNNSIPFSCKVQKQGPNSSSNIPGVQP